MKNKSGPLITAIFTSPLFDTRMGEQVFGDDRDPPPGRSLASALLKTFEAAGFSRHPYRPPSDVAPDDWEHSAWFFFIRFGKLKFTAFLECSMNPAAVDGQWCLTFFQSIGILRAILGGRRDSELPEGFRSQVERVIAETAKCEGIRWVDEAERCRVLYEF